MRTRLGFAVALATAILAGAAGLFYLRTDSTGQTKARYTKFEYRIPMRDGVTLFTQVYIPKDKTKVYPFLVQRTPFGVSSYGTGRYPAQLGPSPEFDRADYIFVFQDVRGRFQSQGEFASRHSIVSPGFSLPSFALSLKIVRLRRDAI
jgi:predicted acyl esterase